MANGASVLLRTVLEIDGGGLDRLRLYISMSYRGARCPICSTMQD